MDRCQSYRQEQAAHPHAFLLRRSDLVADALGRDLSFELSDREFFLDFDSLEGTALTRSSFDVNEDSVPVMGLQAIINLLASVLPTTKEFEEFRTLKVHTAGADAKMHCLIYLVLRDMASKASAVTSR